MAGHNKWSSIKHKKGKNDAARAKIFTKIGRELSVAVKDGGSDPELNAKLRDVIAKAKASNVPNDNIERIIKKASGDVNSANFDSITYEGYGPGGVAVIVETLTDNKNRTAGEVRHAFDKYGGNLGTSGCVSFMFERKGVLSIDNEEIDLDEDTVMEDALEAGAADFDSDDGIFTIYTEIADFSTVRDTLTKKDYKFTSAELEMVPSTYTETNNEDIDKNMETLLTMLEDNDDVQNVWHNWEVPEYLFNDVD